MKKGCLFLSLFISLFLVSCANKENSVAYQNNSDKFIEAVTPTGIGRLTPIAVSFVYEPKESISNCIKLVPEQKGSWEIEGRTAVFTPDKPYKSNSKITLSVDCEKLFGKDSEFINANASNVYKHDFIVGIPKYTIDFDEIRLDDRDDYYIVSGTVTTDIPVSENEIKETLDARLAGKKKSIEWQKSDKGEIWNFCVTDIKSENKDKDFEMAWSGKSLGLTRNQDKYVAGKKTVKIPAAGNFSILDINTSKSDKILVSFSKKLDSSQNIASFVRTLNDKGIVAGDFNTTVRGNVLTIFNDSQWSGIETVSLEKGIKSSDGVYLAQSSNVTLSHNWDIPSVKFMNDNVILPTTQGSVLPIETKNLSGVLIQVYEIYERTIPQFLQENEINGKRELYRVGEPVWEKKVNFTWNDSMQNKYIPRGLDMSELVKKYPHGMFHIRITFRKDQIKYVCRNSHSDFSELPMPPDTIEPYSVPNERSSWDYWEGRNNRDGYWRYDDDPCHPAFYIPSYNSSIVKTQNVIISDLGIMAKRDTNDKIYITVADIRTAKPIPGATVKINNYIGSVVAEGKTNAEGTVVLKDNGKTYVITATLGNQTSYLKVSEGSQLSVSHFEIGGEKLENGLKGFIYGERGVWRPGDTMFLTFVLQDLQKSLPKDIPVTFELKDPMGRSVSKKILTQSLNGFYPITTETPSDATTGLWSASVTIGGKTWYKGLSVETVVPNKLSVELESDEKILKTSNNQFTLKGAWLHGAATPNYNADVSVSFSQAATNFDGYSEYTFTSPLNQIDSTRETIWAGSLDGNSEANFTAFLDAGRNLPGKLKANFISKIYQPSGGFSTQSKSFDFSPYDNYVGIKLPKGDAARNMLLTDTKHTVDVVLLDAEGKASTKNTSLSYNVYQIEWKWWWEKDAYSSATYVNSNHYSRVTSGNVNISKGKGSFQFEVKYPSWGRYLVEVRDGNYGHCAAKIVYIDWPGWAGRAQEGGSGSASMVPLVASKKSYKVGESAEISFTSNSAARALVTVEKAGKVIKQQWIETSTGSNVYKLPLTVDMAPNVYVHLTLLQPHMQTANSLPIRLYGVVPVIVDNPDTQLTPVITMADKFMPNTDATISVSEANGRAMTYTLAVVDEGLLGLTNFHGPNLRNEFYKKEASLLESWDIYRYVMNAYSGKLETILAIGGSEDLVDNAGRNENRFSPVVRYFGPYSLAAGEKKATTFQMPHYIGAVRAIVIAGTANGAYGTAEKSVPVKSDLMVQPSIPRSLGTNESITIPVTVFNGMETSQTVIVTMSTRGIVNFSKSQEVKIGAGENKVLTFPIETKAAGKVVIDVTAKTATMSVKASENVEIKSRGIPVTYRTPFVVKAGSKVSPSVQIPAEKGSANLVAELSTLPQIDLSNRLEYLTSYPHGCIEQITSGGFPQLFISDYVKLSPQEVNKIKENVISVFDRYPTYQTTSGAFGYWPGNQSPHAWGTCYATHFMLEAKKKGYSVPEGILSPALQWLKESAGNWTTNSNDSESIQAYRLFVLSLAGMYDTGAMNRLSTTNLSNDGKLLLAAAYANSGRKSVATDILKGLSISKSYRRFDDSFSSSIRENAMYLYACVKADYVGNVPNIAKSIANTLASDKWLSTQEAAWSLYALLPYYSQQKVQDASYSIVSNGTKRSGDMSNVTVTEKLPVSYKNSTMSVEIENTGKAVLYGTLICSGVSLPGTEKTQNEGLRMEVDGLSSKDISDLRTGDTVPITVTIRNTSGTRLTNLALTIPRATGFEFTNERVGNESYSNSSYTYQDIRDDAIYTYFDLSNGDSVTYTFNATVAYSGKFYIPAIHVEAMYDNSYVAVFPGQLVSAQ